MANGILPAGLPTGLAAARFVSYALLLIAAGVPFHALIDRRSRFGARGRLALALLAMGAGAASLWWAMANVAAMAGMPLAELDRETFTAVIAATPLGPLLTVRAAALALFLAALALYPSPRLLAPCALAALASAAWAGHAGVGAGAGEALSGDILRAGDVLHLAAAALWLGAMLAFLADMPSKRAKAGGEADVIRSLAAFARTGTVVVAVLFATGLVNSWLISGDSLPSGLWPRLIGLKLGLFLLMLGFAARNRWTLVPALEAGKPGAARRLTCSLTLEMACAVAIVLVVAVVGLLDPHGA
jgi:putative copper resistance protein D